MSRRLKPHVIAAITIGASSFVVAVVGWRLYLKRRKFSKQGDKVKLFRNQAEFEGGKYLVQRRDGSVPGWPHFVIGAADPCAPAALRAYADAAAERNYDLEYISDIRDLANEFEAYLETHEEGDPEIIAKMRNGA